MSKQRKSTRRSPQQGGVVRHPELRPLAKLATDVLASARTVGALPRSSDAMEVFDRHVLERGCVTLDAVKLLVAQGHWEVASAPTRQLFELLINMEYVAAQTDRVAAVGRFFLFGQLQVLLAAQERFKYEQNSGRAVDASRLADIDQDLAGAQFDQFRHKPKSNGDPNWASSWNSKSARDMSEASPDKMRTKQYKVLFSAWSEQAHGTPGAVIGQMMREDMRAVDSVRAREEVVTRSMETLAMALTLFVELWMNLGNVSQPKLEQFMESNPRQRINIVVYNSFGEMKQSNIGIGVEWQNTGGVTKLVGNKMIVYFDGDHENLRRQIRQGIARIMLETLLFGEDIGEFAGNAALIDFPKWFTDGFIGYAAENWTAAQDEELKLILMSGKYNNFNLAQQ